MTQRRNSNWSCRTGRKERKSTSTGTVPYRTLLLTVNIHLMTDKCVLQKIIITVLNSLIPSTYRTYRKHDIRN